MMHVLRRYLGNIHPLDYLGSVILNVMMAILIVVEDLKITLSRVVHDTKRCQEIFKLLGEI